MIRLEGKRVLVTGASSGIGNQVAQDFLERGAIVGAHYRSGEEGARKLLGLAGADKCRIFQADFTIAAEVRRLWDEFIDWTQGIDVLVNNAGEAFGAAPLRELSEDAWDRTFQVNVRAPFLLSQSALAFMEKQGSGRIINISSVGVKFGGGDKTVHYSASKAALEALTKSFAKAGAPRNVLVNAVRAGVTDTPLHRNVSPSAWSERSELIPLKRAAQPSEISDAVLFLAGDQSSYITGTTLTVAGGE